MKTFSKSQRTLGSWGNMKVEIDLFSVRMTTGNLMEVEGQTISWTS